MFSSSSRQGMQYSEGSLGRVFVLRLDDGEDLIASLEGLAREKGVAVGVALFMGALKDGRMVTGPEEAVIPPTPHWEGFQNAWEVVGMASIYPGEKGPMVHIHSSLGRGRESLTGCVRIVASVYLIVEAVLFELLEVDARRVLDERSGLHLLSLRLGCPDSVGLMKRQLMERS
jgi:predicted DNA-binding protein with PD1-like motif